LSEPNPTGANPGPTRTSVAVIAVTMALLALLVWFLNPRQPNFKPAPLEPPSPVCKNPGREFVPSNVTAVSDPGLERLPVDRKNAAIRGLNTTACTCGCQLSVVYCRGMNPACDTSKQMLGKIVNEAAEKPTQAPGKK
jgi:hypothetical protein